MSGSVAHFPVLLNALNNLVSISFSSDLTGHLYCALQPILNLRHSRNASLRLMYALHVITISEVTRQNCGSYTLILRVGADSNPYLLKSGISDSITMGACLQTIINHKGANHLEACHASIVQSLSNTVAPAAELLKAVLKGAFIAADVSNDSLGAGIVHMLLSGAIQTFAPVQGRQGG